MVTTDDAYNILQCMSAVDYDLSPHSITMRTKLPARIVKSAMLKLAFEDKIAYTRTVARQPMFTVIK